MNTKADRPECECRVELQEHEVRSNSGITRNLYGSLPLTSNSAIIYRCVVMYFCTGHGINRIMCVADAERIGA
ncbi:hypothetical protein DWW70_13700 [Coprococcus sp. AF16-5]|nr:hypothetical protein DWW70_13700 [Coprococcus sp. AF16-5]